MKLTNAIDWLIIRASEVLCIRTLPFLITKVGVRWQHQSMCERVCMCGSKCECKCVCVCAHVYVPMCACVHVCVVCAPAYAVLRIRAGAGGS